MKTAKIFLTSALFCVLTGAVGNVMAQAATCSTPTTTFKMATLAPEGSALYKGLDVLKTDLLAKTGGCVGVQIYGGGQMGDEIDVARKLRNGQLDGAAFTGRGLNEILPEIRVLELPFLFKNQNQIDAVYSQLKKYFQDQFLTKNFVLLGWAETGLVQVFSTKPITSRKDLEGQKIWVWTGDEFAQTFLDVLKVVPVPLAVTDVLPSLQTGLIQVCYNTPLGALAFQWPTKAKYMSKIDITNATGGLIVTKASFDKLTATQQTLLQQTVDEVSKKMIAQSRTDNASAIPALQSTGVQVVSFTPEAMDELRAAGKEIQARTVGKFYPQSLLDKVNQIVASVP